MADVLSGDYNPTGHLPVTFYSSTAELGDFSDYEMKAGKGKTYRYYKGAPLFPFAHGLSYTTFMILRKMRITWSRGVLGASSADLRLKRSVSIR